MVVLLVKQGKAFALMKVIVDRTLKTEHHRYEQVLDVPDWS